MFLLLRIDPEVTRIRTTIEGVVDIIRDTYNLRTTALMYPDVTDVCSRIIVTCKCGVAVRFRIVFPKCFSSLCSARFLLSRVASRVGPGWQKQVPASSVPSKRLLKICKRPWPEMVLHYAWHRSQITVCFTAENETNSPNGVASERAKWV